MKEVEYQPSPVKYRLRPRRNYIRVESIEVEIPNRSGWPTHVGTYYADNPTQFIATSNIGIDTHTFLYNTCSEFIKHVPPAPVHRNMSTKEIRSIIINYLIKFTKPVSSRTIVQELTHSERTAANKVRQVLADLRKIDRVVYIGTGWRVVKNESI